MLPVFLNVVFFVSKPLKNENKKPTEFSYFSTFSNSFRRLDSIFRCFLCFFFVFVFWGVLFCFGLFFWGDGSSMHLCIFKIMYQFVGLLVMSFRGSLLILTLMRLFLSSRFILELMIHHTVPFLNF